MKHHIWKVFQFSGWFITLVGVIFGLLLAGISFGQDFLGAVFLVVLGIILVLVGEFLIAQGGKDTPYHMVWQALSIGGAFALTIGMVWGILQFLETYQNAISIIVLIAVGVVLIVVGEFTKVKKKK